MTYIDNDRHGPIVHRLRVVGPHVGVFRQIYVARYQAETHTETIAVEPHVRVFRQIYLASYQAERQIETTAVEPHVGVFRQIYIASYQADRQIRDHSSRAL